MSGACAVVLQRHLAQHPRQRERDAGRSPPRSRKTGVRASVSGADVGGVGRGRKVRDRLGVRGRRQLRARREAVGEVRRELVREHGAERRDADRAADLAEERRAGGRDAEVLVVDRVLGGEHEHLHHHPEPEAEHEHVGARHDGGGVRLEARQQHEADRHDRGAGDRERPVAPVLADQLAAHDRGDEDAGHHRRDQQARDRRAVALHVLQVERQVGDGAEERRGRR